MVIYNSEDNNSNEESASFTPYDIVSSASDFNLTTIFNFIQSGTFEIPGFQRNYIWDIRRASKLIESFIIGLPVPQIFLYEKLKDKFLVIDGQQRLMTIYYFIKGRFPRIDKRGELRKIFSEHNEIPNNVLHDDSYFQEFNLVLPNIVGQGENPLNGLNYNTLSSELHSTFDLKPIRSIIIKQIRPPNEDSSIYEIFNRLNSGGINLQPQEIRTSLYHSEFYDAIKVMNNIPEWRKLYGKKEHIHMKDIETILRGFAFLIKKETYKPSLNQFLNSFSEDMTRESSITIKYLMNLFTEFIKKAVALERDIFFSKKNVFNILLYETVFYAVCREAYLRKDLNIKNIDPNRINSIKENKKFIFASSSETGKKHNVEIRFSIAESVFEGI